MSTCAKCGNHFFEIAENEPAGSKYKVYFVQCSSCDAPIGVLEYANSAAFLEGIEVKIDQLTNNVQQLSYDVSNIQNDLRRR